ncbi:hypothetical protein [Pantoea agglomerans]|uniref:hypothetical protein n=1 Tax=Enterobacter agglomerans TaxID=549 RepID=UPI0013CBEEBE|nr:hypothetical protein [Pantoea agglomerans]NEG59759.1 hypothetical protein [Pantoea agglomerans]NEH05297.1 hypothetical protein [Pantoea agglomerans]NEH16327.1 hypothetical protein [Pantoea agglomerans]
MPKQHGKLKLITSFNLMNGRKKERKPKIFPGFVVMRGMMQQLSYNTGTKKWIKDPTITTVSKTVTEAEAVMKTSPKYSKTAEIRKLKTDVRFYSSDSLSWVELSKFREAEQTLSVS